MDISYAVNQVSQFCNNLGLEHLNAVKRIIRYLRGTSGHKLTYSRDRESVLTGSTDADWGGDLDSRKSTSAYVFMGNNFILNSFSGMSSSVVRRLQYYSI